LGNVSYCGGTNLEDAHEFKLAAHGVDIEKLVAKKGDQLGRGSNLAVLIWLDSQLLQPFKGSLHYLLQIILN
jgi:hypothetical protein